MVFMSDINDNAIPVFCFFHIKAGKHFNRTVYRVYEPAPAFHENPDLSAGSSFLFTDGVYDLRFFLFGKKINSFSRKE
jgi:hypothetical protein